MKTQGAIIYAVALCSVSYGLRLINAEQANCNQGEVNVFIANEDATAYGATKDDQCVDFCFARAILQFIPNIQEGRCAGQGYSVLVSSDVAVQPIGSPAPISVDIYERDAAVTGGIAAYAEDDRNPSIFDGPCIDCPAYVSLDAGGKLDRLWSKIMKYEYDELPTNWLYSSADANGIDSLIKKYEERVNMVFDRVSDERPPNFPRFFHEYGSIAQVEFVPSSIDHGFTGVYGEGNNVGIIRISFCSPIDGEKLNIRQTYAFSAKFLRDGIHSSNIVTCEGPGQTYTRDPSLFSVFKHLVHTASIIPPPLDEFFSLAQDQTGLLSVADDTWFWKNGTTVENPIAPLIIHYFPNDDLNAKNEYNEDFREELPDIPAGTTLYTAYTAVDDDGNPTICTCHETDAGGIPCFRRDSLIAKCNLVELGSLVSRSHFVHSDYGDNGILFKHNRACQEERQLCEYDAEIPYEDSTFSQSSNRNAMCVSQRSVQNYECPISIANDNGGVSKLAGIRSYCSSEGEREKEKMCPFAKMLHPSFSGPVGESYPIPPDDHFTACSALGNQDDISTAASSILQPSLVRIKCCKAINKYLTDDSHSESLQQICNDDECMGEFERAFPNIVLQDKCALLEPLISCNFDIQAGPMKLPYNFLVSDKCCNAVIVHSDASGTATSRNNALHVICLEGDSCVTAYDPLYQQGQVFLNPSNDLTLAETCKMKDMVPNDADDESVDNTSSAFCVFHHAYFIAASLLALFFGILY